MKLREALRNGLISLTDLEKRCLQEIRNQGSFYEESLGREPFESSAFLGWELYESEVKGCRGALSSLSKKGILDIVEDDDCSGYYINYELEFDTNGWKILFD